MTVEELKVEAAKLGYKIIKKQEYIKFKPCICGCNKRGLWYRSGGTRLYKCNNCGLEAPEGSNDKEAKLNWNKMIEENEKWEILKTKKLTS